MPFQVSPGVNVTEIDLTTVVPAVSSTEGALAGVFRWGPVDERTLVSSESELVARYGKPTNFNAETFFTGANFLAYGNKLFVARGAKTTNPSNPTIQLAAGTNFNAGDVAFQNNASGNTATATVVSVSGNLVTLNVSTLVGVFSASVNTYSSNATPGNQSTNTVTMDATIATSAVANTGVVTNFYNYIVKNENDYDVKDTNSQFTDLDVEYIAKYPGALGNSLKISVCDSAAAYSKDTFLTSATGVSTTTGNLQISATTTKVATEVGSSNVTVTVGANAYNGVFSVTNVTGTLTVGNALYQSNGSVNVAIGTISLVNSTHIGVTSTTSQNVGWQLYSTGSFVIQDATTSGTARITGLFASQLPTTIANTALQSITVGDYVEVGNSSIGKQYLKVSAVDTAITVNNTSQTASFTIRTEDKYALAANYDSSAAGNAGNKFTRKWEYFNNVDAAPGTTNYVTNFGNTSAVDELHAVIVDEDGQISGVAGTILEVYQGLSRATDAKTDDGAANYYKTVINDTSQYVWFASHRSESPAALAAAIASSSATKPLTLSFGLGQDGADESTAAFADVTRGYDLFASADDVDVSLILTGKSRGGTNGEQLANYLIDNVAESRRDCVVFVSPERGDVVRVTDGSEETKVVDFRNSLRSTSYAVLDSGYKYQYDKYNDLYRWVPLNGDTAGLCVRTDDTRDPWFSPAGFNRGQIKNIIKLAFNPNKAERDVLYKAGVNPVVSFPGQGTILFGDKTLLARPSAFDRINVRRLFIVLEKAIATAAKSSLFEFNDEFTRAQFRSLVEPFLRDVQGRRGIYDFKVVCDNTNNTGEVIDRNEFVGDIYIKPAKSINFIQLNFIAVRTGVEFSEVIGQF